MADGMPPEPNWNLDDFVAYQTDAVELPAYYDNKGRPTQTRLEVTCPFCGEKVACYRWSLAGSGKRCTGCKRLLTQYGGWKK
jgi:hypothetical protein